jgi:hypothetical protein
MVSRYAWNFSRGGPGHKLLVGLIFFVIIEEKFISII